MRLYHDFAPAPESDLATCSTCDEETVEHVPAWLGIEAYDHCTNESCPSNHEDDEI